MIGIAWIATLLLSNLPLVIARDVLGADIPWMPSIWLATAAVLAGATYLWPALQPLRRYFAIMGVIVLMTAVVQPLVWESAVWQRFAATQPEMVGLFGSRVSLLLSPLVVLLALYLMGYSRRESFLTRGRLRAPVQGIGLPGGRRLSWALLGPAVSLLLAGLFFLFLLTQDPAVGSGLGRALRWLPLILASAALNAFVEEATYRAAPLATLLPAIGGRHAIWLTSLWFGLGHYYGGIPSGPVGLVQSGLLAVLLGKAMVDTRGMGWSWTIHVAMDTVIYVALAATS
jgi:membrane protease YdiL (CAAX protease family)